MNLPRSSKRRQSLKRPNAADHSRTQDPILAMPDQAPLQDDNTLQFPEGEDGPLVRPNAPLSVVDLGGGAFAVTEHSPQVPSLAAAFHRTLDGGAARADPVLRCPVSHMLPTTFLFGAFPCSSRLKAQSKNAPETAV